jgi:hypothetical protein
MSKTSSLLGMAGALPAIAQAADSADRVDVYIGSAGVSGVWVLANISYAGMRAQGHPSTLWRVVSFIAGFPGTIISWLAVKEGSCRAYGVTLPPRNTAG